MIKIEGTTISCTRGDRVGFDFNIKEYTFQNGDTIGFRVYEKKGFNNPPLIDKLITIDEECEKVNITLSSEETSIGEIENKPVEYWYEIELNDDQTIIGYDEEGAKIFMLYPEGVEIK